MQVNRNNLANLIFDGFFNKDHPKYENIKNIIISGLRDQGLEFILDVLDKDYIPVKKGGFAKVKLTDAIEAYKLEGFLSDMMLDLGIMTEDGYIYCRIKKSDDYGEDFDPYYHNMQVEYYVHHHEETGTITSSSAKVKTSCLQAININEVPQIITDYCKITKPQSEDPLPF